MRAKDLIVGQNYMIYYRHNIDVFDMTTTGRKYYEPEKYGKGKLIAINEPNVGFHTFQLDGTAVLAYATSRGVVTHVDNTLLPKVHFTTDFTSDPPLPPMSKELEKLTKLGYDDQTRVKEIISIVSLLSDLGVHSVPNSDNTAITIPWVGLATFKTLIKSLYKRSILEGLEDEG